MKTVAVVPMKLNNRRLPQKNTKPFTNGKPLCWYILSTLLQVRGVEEVYVYCSNPEIQEFLPEGVKYLRRGEDYLMLHRVKKQNDVNQDKWIGVGGKFEADESPEDCLLREVREETGLNLTRYQYRGIVTFVSERWVTEYMHLFTADGWTGEIGECSEGVLEWVPRSRLLELPHWEGDAIFLDLLARDVPFFSLKLRYDKDDQLVEAVLNGEKIR